jgi:hypothetical protein
MCNNWDFPITIACKTGKSHTEVRTSMWLNMIMGMVSPDIQTTERLCVSSIFTLFPAVKGYGTAIRLFPDNRSESDRCLK